MSKKVFAVLSVLMIASLIFTACAPAQTPVVQQPAVKETVVVTKEVVKEVVLTPTPQPEAPQAAAPKTITVNFGAGDVPTLDPGIAEDTSSITAIEEMYVGLTRLDEVTSELQPGMAESWDISEDGKTYTFKLRTDVPWVKYNGTEVVKVQDCSDPAKDRMVTAKDFEYGILRALKPETASPYAYVLGFAIEGAADFNSGAITDPAQVGVKALDDATLEIKFLEPAAYNGNIAGLWTAFPAPQWIIEGDDCTDARGDRWIEPGFYQSYGPYALKDWVHDSTLTVIKNPFWPGSDAVPQPKIEEITWLMLDEVAAMAEYEAGTVDSTAVPTADIDRVKSDPTLSAEYVVAPNLCTYYYGINTTAPFVDDARVRRALSMAVDRQGLIDNVLKGGQEPAQWFARPGLAAAPTMDTHPDLGIKSDPAAAKAELDAYLAEKGITVADVDITLMFNTSSGHQRIAEAIQQMWKDALGLDVKIVNQEWQVFLETTKGKDTPQVYRMGWCLDYPDANNFTREVMAVGGSQNPVNPDGTPQGGLMWKNEKFEELVRQAASEQDPAKRVELYAEAENILVNTDAAIIPIYWYTRNTVTKPYITRTFSVGGHERYEKWDIDMAAKEGQ